MRNSKKASLCSSLMKIIPNANLPKEIVYVNGGETLLFQIKWLLFTNFSNMYKLYKKHCAANMDTVVLCLIVVEVVPPQKIYNIKIEVAKFCQTLPSYQMKNT